MGLTVTNSLSLRMYYKDNKTLVTSANRSEATTGKLSYADASALRVAIKRLADYKYDESTDDDLEEKLRAFCDTYNYAITTASKYGSNNTIVKNAASRIKSLTSDYSSTLEKYGITVDKNTGYMTMSDTATSNISHESFEKIFGADSEYMNSLYKNARQIRNHIDITL